MGVCSWAKNSNRGCGLKIHGFWDTAGQKLLGVRSKNRSESRIFTPVWGGDKTKKSSRTKTVTNLAIAQMKGAIYLPTTVKQCIIFKAFLF